MRNVTLWRTGVWCRGVAVPCAGVCGCVVCACAVVCCVRCLRFVMCACAVAAALLDGRATCGVAVWLRAGAVVCCCGCVGCGGVRLSLCHCVTVSLCDCVAMWLYGLFICDCAAHAVV